MKKIILGALALSIMGACNTKSESQNYVTFSGKITNPTGKQASIITEKYKKTFIVDENGEFSDTLNITGFEGHFTFSDGTEYTPLYLKNGYDINLTLNTEEFDETVKYTGKGNEANNYLAKKGLLMETAIDFESLLEADSVSFKNEVENIVTQFDDLLINEKGLDSTFITSEKEELVSLSKEIIEEYTYITKRAKKMKALIGTESPIFENYESINKEKVSLSDFKGKYVYVDVWATWCAPCKAEIPYLQKTEEAYHDKNIVFVSISVDDLKDKAKWETMVKDKEMGGVQLFANNSWQSDFITDFEIQGIPRFILIDPTGKIVDADAPRPSDDKLTELLDSLEL
jgi:thiol-disulfide isomerase/thioredoxin